MFKRIVTATLVASSLFGSVAHAAPSKSDVINVVAAAYLFDKTCDAKVSAESKKDMAFLIRATGLDTDAPSTKAMLNSAVSAQSTRIMSIGVNNWCREMKPAFTS